MSLLLVVGSIAIFCYGVLRFLLKRHISKSQLSIEVLFLIMVLSCLHLAIYGVGVPLEVNFAQGNAYDHRWDACWLLFGSTAMICIILAFKAITGLGMWMRGIVETRSQRAIVIPHYAYRRSLWSTIMIPFVSAVVAIPVVRGLTRLPILGPILQRIFRSP